MKLKKNKKYTVKKHEAGPDVSTKEKKETGVLGSSDLHEMTAAVRISWFDPGVKAGSRPLPYIFSVGQFEPSLGPHLRTQGREFQRAD